MLGRRSATVTLSQIAELAGVGASAVSNWRKRFDDFPTPTETAAGGRDLYSLADVEAWLRAHSRLDPERVNERLLFEAADLVRGQAPADEVVTILATAIALAHAVEELSIDSEDRTAHSLVKEVVLSAPGSARIFTPIEDLDPRLADEIFDLASMIAPNERPKVFEQVLGRRGRFVETRTSPELVSLIVRLAGDGKAILDPAAGEGGFLAASAESSSANRRLYGQEINEAAWRTARQRFLMRSIDVDLQLGDSMLDDAFPHLLVDAVVCDPPYGTKNPLRPIAPTESRWNFAFSRLQTGDYLWLHHVIQHVASDGRGYVLLPSGSLFRRGREGELRRELIRSGAIEAIVSLPGGSAQHTHIPLALWILRNPGSLVDPDPILFVDSVTAQDPVGRRPRLDGPLADRIVAIVEHWRRSQRVEEEDADLAAAYPVLDLLAADADLVPSRWVYQGAGVDSEERERRYGRALERFRRSREIASSVPTPSLSSQIGEAHEWVTVRELVASGVAEIVRGIHVKREDCQTTGVRVLRTRDLRDENADDPCYLDPEMARPSVALTRAADIIVSPASGVLRALVDESGGNILARPLQGLRLRNAWLDPKVAAAFLESPRNRRFARGMDYGYARVDLRDLELPMLPPSEQKALRDQLEQLAHLERAARELSSSAREMREMLVDWPGPETNG